MGMTAQNEPLKMTTAEHLEARQVDIHKNLQDAWAEVMQEAEKVSEKPVSWCLKLEVVLPNGATLTSKSETKFEEPSPKAVAIEASVGGTSSTTT
jgi:hypothetical protein